MKRLNKRILLSIMLAAALAATALLAGCQGAAPVQGGVNNAPLTYGASSQNPASNGISVSGQGSVSVKPDVATIQLGVQTMDADAGKARKANNDAMDKVIAAVKGLGVAAEDIATTQFSIYPQYDRDGVKVTGFTVYNMVVVKVKALAKLGDVISAAVDAGANSSYGINFDVLDRSAAYRQALEQAMDKAKARAELMAKACGVKLGKVLTVNESSYSQGRAYEMADMAMASKAGGTPVSAGQMDVTASVSVVYEIVK